MFVPVHATTMVSASMELVIAILVSRVLIARSNPVRPNVHSTESVVMELACANLGGLEMV